VLQTSALDPHLLKHMSNPEDENNIQEPIYKPRMANAISSAFINIQYQYKAVLILILNIEYSTVLA